MKDKTKKILFSAISGMAIIGTGLGLGLGFGLPEKDSDGVSTKDTTSYTSIGELWDAEKQGFVEENLNTLFTSITGVDKASITDIDTLASSTATAADIRTNNGGKDIVVRLGGLDWQVMYLSKDSDGNAIATLWLSNNEQDAFAGRSSSEGAYYGFIKSSVSGNTGLYSDWSADWYTTTTSNGTSAFYPSAMYGTSYMRAVTLNNGGVYATSNTALTTATKNTNNIFAPFTMPTNGENNDLTDFIVTPAKVSWQKDQSSKTIQGTSYNYPNDAWNTATSDTGFYSAAYNYAEHSNYAQWANDYLWLPSIAETGYSATYTGLWKPSTNQRMNYDRSSTSITNVSIGTSANANYATTAYTHSWLRSGYRNNADTACLLNPSGANYSNNIVNSSQAVRPALHLNLDLANEYMTPPTWIDFADTDWEGSGTQAKPYLISTPEELAGIAYNVNNDVSTYSGIYFKQTVNIDLAGRKWTPIGEETGPVFQGNYDGNNFIIEGIFINTEERTQGLFARVNLGDIRNITLKNSIIISSEQNIGGIIGIAQETIVENCVNYAYIKGADDVGGIVGEADKAQISNCYNYGNIVSNLAAGGIAGYSNNNTGTFIQRSINVGSLEGAWVGGIVGYSDAVLTISNCISQGDLIAIDNSDKLEAGLVVAEAGIGSIIGYINKRTTKIDNCACFNKILVKNLSIEKVSIFAGGVNADASIDITNCSYYGVSNKNIASLVLGEGNKTIKSSYFSINGIKKYTSGDFSGYTIVNNMNDGLPIQNALYSVAIGGYTSDEVITDLQNKGFTLYS